MTPCFAVEFKTPKGYALRGLWFGPKTPKRAIVWVHGLGGSVFSTHDIVRHLAGRGTAVFMFNNRGHDRVSYVSKRVGNRNKRLKAGAAHEVFAECVDDISGALAFVRSQGVRSVYLAGHSTGCQKSVFWAHKTKGKGVRGILLLAPVSDFAAQLHLRGRANMAPAEKAARSLIERGEQHSLLPEKLSPEVVDAQRFLSLYTPESVEEVFPYAQPGKKPRALRSLKLPILVLWPREDEYADRPADEIAAWFGREIKGRHRVVVIPGAGHSFKGAERRVARAIKEFIGP